MLYLGKQKAAEANKVPIDGPKLQILEWFLSPRDTQLQAPSGDLRTRFHLDRTVEVTLKGRCIVWIIVPVGSRTSHAMLGMRCLSVVMRKDQMLEPEGRDPTFHVIGAENNPDCSLQEMFLHGGTDAWIYL